MNARKVKILSVVILSGFVGCGESGEETPPISEEAEILELDTRKSYEEALAEGLKFVRASEPKHELTLSFGTPILVEDTLQKQWSLLDEKRAFRTVQGDVNLRVNLPSGESLVERCSFVVVEKDERGICRVMADSYEDLGRDEVGDRINSETKFFQTLGADAGELDRQDAKIREWLKSGNDGTTSTQGFFFRRDRIQVSFQFSVYEIPQFKARVRYELKLVEDDSMRLEKRR